MDFHYQKVEQQTREFCHKALSVTQLTELLRDICNVKPDPLYSLLNVGSLSRVLYQDSQMPNGEARNPDTNHTQSPAAQRRLSGIRMLTAKKRKKKEEEQ